MSKLFIGCKVSSKGIESVVADSKAMALEKIHRTIINGSRYMRFDNLYELKRYILDAKFKHAARVIPVVEGSWDNLQFPGFIDITATQCVNLSGNEIPKPALTIAGEGTWYHVYNLNVDSVDDELSEPVKHFVFTD